MIAQFIHEHVDCADDKKNKIRNMTQVWGKEFTKKLCYAFLFLAAVSSISLYVLKTINEIFLFSTVVFCIYLTFKFKKIRVIEKKFRKSYKILAMIIGGIYILTKIFF
jgi:4-hydroxybenzoate polyprenyltransferase